MDERNVPKAISEDEDEAGCRWGEGVAMEWAEDLTDPRQDIYTWEDGQPIEPDPSTPLGPDRPSSES